MGLPRLSRRGGPARSPRASAISRPMVITAGQRSPRRSQNRRRSGWIFRFPGFGCSVRRRRISSSPPSATPASASGADAARSAEAPPRPPPLRRPPPVERPDRDPRRVPSRRPTRAAPRRPAGPTGPEPLRPSLRTSPPAGPPAPTGRRTGSLSPATNHAKSARARAGRAPRRPAGAVPRGQPVQRTANVSAPRSATSPLTGHRLGGEPEAPHRPLSSATASFQILSEASSASVRHKLREPVFNIEATSGWRCIRRRIPATTWTAKGCGAHPFRGERHQAY